MFKHSDIQYTTLTLDNKLNSLIYRTLFYVNIYESYKLLKQSGFYWPTLYMLQSTERCKNEKVRFSSDTVSYNYNIHDHGWQVSASTGLNLGLILNRFKQSWQKQVSTRVSAGVFEPVFIQNCSYTAVIFVLFCSILFSMVQLEFCYPVQHYNNSMTVLQNRLRRYVLSVLKHFYVVPFLPVIIIMKVVQFLYAQVQSH